MRNALILIFLLISSVVGATTYYIDPAGNNSNNGSSGSPWKTLTYACSKVTTSGDIIHVNAGTYPETAQSFLSVGVSIEGAGNTSIIRSSVTGANTYTLNLSSASQGTNGNQSISNIRMEGGMTAYAAILVERRSNVSIHHCEFADFFSRGIMFTAVGYGSDGVPTSYSTGNTFHDNKVTNCADYVSSGKFGDGLGNLNIGGQQGMLVYNNTIVQTDRGADANGYCIKFASQGFNKGLEIYNNTLTKPPYDNSTWDFAIELWNSRGGIKIYNNNIQGGIDIGGNTSITNDVGGYGFAEKIYNNVIGFNTLQSVSENGIYVERGVTGGIYIYNNLLKNLNSAIVFYPGSTDIVENIYIYYNVINGVGTSGQTNMGNATDWGTIDGSSSVTYRNINFINNTLYAGTSGNPLSGIRFNLTGNASNITIRNNILQGFKAFPIYLQNTGSTSSVSVENNLYYGNGTNAASYYNSVSSKTEQNNLVANPNFVSPGSDFHLLTGSPAIGKGLAISGMTTDFSGNSVKNPPSIGAYENGSTAAAPLVAPVYQSSAVANATPSLLEMTYDLSLNSSIVPATSSFSIMVNSAARAVSQVAIAGAKVQLTMASAVKAGDVITVSYTKPATNPLQTTAGGQPVSVSGKPVTNNCASTVPIYSTSAVQNTTPTLLEMTYNLTLANIVPAASSFAVLVNSAATAVSSVVISGTKVQLTLASAIKYGDLITVSYTKPATNPLQSTTGSAAVSISGQLVTNNLINPTKDAPITVTLTLYPFYVHNILNVLLAYSATPTATMAPEIIRISNLAGTLFIEKYLVTGVTNVKIPLNLRSGIYIVKMLANGLEMASKKIIVY